MLRNHYGSDRRNDGCTKKIRVDDFSDIADITWEEDAPMMRARSKGEKPSKDILHRSKKTVILWNGNVEKDKDKQCCIEHMMREKYNII